uniref:Uncharacterized protein n=1 Tax=Triticum urartu TaxID=4572 RepID=A0A8R7TVP1_TRIUA
MQEALISLANADRLRSAFELKPYGFGDQRLSSSPRYLPGGDDGLYRCSSPFSPSLGFSSPSPLATSVSLSPSSSASLVDDGDYDGAAAADATGHRLQLARLALQYQEVADRYELCLSHLAEAVDEAAILRRENAELRVANSDLARRVALLGGKETAAVVIADEIRRFRLGEHKGASKQRAPEKLAVLPKSISVRSNDYLKMNQAAPAAATPAVYNCKPSSVSPCSRLANSAYARTPDWERTAARKARSRRASRTRRGSWTCTTRACSRRSCATSGRRRGRAPTATSASSRTASPSCAPSSATRGTRPRSAAWCSTARSAPTATAATSATRSPPPSASSAAVEAVRVSSATV